MRIDELVKLIGTDVSGKWVTTENTKTIANMVLQECLALIEPGNERISDANVDLLKLKIRNHFGL